MTKKSMKLSKNRLNGEARFQEFYQEIYETRWSELCHALTTTDVKFPRVHKHIYKDALDYSACLNENENLENKKLTYLMDYASFLAAECLPFKKGDKILDMCSSPGGKALALLSKMQGAGSITLNDVSKKRIFKLRAVLKQFEESHNSQIHITNKDALRFGIESPGYFDAVLLDAPCSSEAHILQSPDHLKIWSPSRTKYLAKKQYGLLCSALLSVKEQGSIIYSTCSISPKENDGVIDRLLHRKSTEVEVQDLPDELFKMGERTDYGAIFLPDKAKFGPLFICLLKKLP